MSEKTVRAPRRVVVWAPGHDEQDRRVNRVIEVLGRLDVHITVVYDAAYASPVASGANRSVTVLHLPGGRRGVLAAIKGLRKWLTSIDQPTDLLYIHDSGLYGLMLAALAARHQRSLRIIFDYHDWIPWEIWYQWNKVVRWPQLARLLAGLSQKMLLPVLGRSVAFRGLVGISPGQLSGLRKVFHTWAEVPSVAIPNTRNRLDDPPAGVPTGALTLLWVGNVMEGRDLDRLLGYAEAVRRDEPQLELSVLVVGRVISERMLQRLNAVPYIRHVSGFSDDGHLREIVAGVRAVGVFLGWDDEAGTEINRIASPNKIYSYVNIGVPVIFARSLEAVAEVVPAPAGFPVSDYAEFRHAVIDVAAEYPNCFAAVQALRGQPIWDEQAQGSLLVFLDSQLACRASPDPS